ncbi:MAG: NAD-specific glutamate dehydrogenase protein [Leptospirillum sp. Group IV 'UBA BS']|nr:MAG: NAD-specific glutamate dehydrogenase protein [Leptospirillum sp. Group IV 'UBA BS']
MLQGAVDDLAVEVVSSQMIVAVTRQDLDHLPFDVDDRHIEGPAPKVVDEQLSGGIQALLVGKCGRRGLVQDAHHLEPRDFSRFARRLPLGIGKEGGNGDDGLSDRLSQMGLGRLLQTGEDHGGNFLGSVLVLPHRDLPELSHAPLDGPDSAFRMQDILVPGRLSHQESSAVADPHHRRKNPGIPRNGDDLHPSVLDHGHLGVCRPQVDSNDDTIH